MIYFVGYDKNGVGRHSKGRFGIYNDNANTMSFFTYAKLKGYLEQGVKIKGLEEVENEIINGNPEFVNEEVLTERLVYKNYIVNDEMCINKKSSVIRITIEKPVIFDRLVEDLGFTYKCLNVRASKKVGQTQLRLMLTTNATLNSMEQLAEDLEELAFCLGYNNARLLDWYIQFPTLNEIDISLIDNLCINTMRITKHIGLNLAYTSYLKLGQFDNQFTKYVINDISDMPMLKILDLTECDITDSTPIHVVQFVHRYMCVFGQVQFSISDKSILDRVLEEIHIKHKERSEGIELNFLGTFNRDIGIGEQAKRQMGKMRLLGRANTVFVVNLVET